MGKRLIIRGADFSANAVGQITEVSLLDSLTLILGKAWKTMYVDSKELPQSSEYNSKRCATELTDISEIASEVGAVTFTPKSGYKFAVYFGTGGNDNIVGWNYFTEATSFDITNCTKAIIMVAATNDAELSSTDWATYLTES